MLTNLLEAKVPFTKRQNWPRGRLEWNEYIYIYSTDKSDYTLFPLRFWALIRGEFIYHRSWRFAFVIPFNLFHCVHSRIE